MSKSKILFIFTGSIACYKAINVVSKLVQEGHSVQCVLTSSAAQFIGKATLEGLTSLKVHTDLFEEGSIMGHIKLIRDADVVVVAPATANFINKIASGIADDLASTLFLAHDFKKPFIVVPAMNSAMYSHPVTQRSLKELSELGLYITDTGTGILACGEVGYGKLLEPELILKEINKIMSQGKSSIPTSSISITAKKPLKPQRILITGGGTTERIDSVRSITNTSTGTTAVKMAEFMSELGFAVTLVLAQSYSQEVSKEVLVKHFVSFNDLNRILKSELATTHYDFLFHAAAVSDFSVKMIKNQGKKITAQGKVDSHKELTLTLKPNIKIISKLQSYSINKKMKIIGFKLTDSKIQKEKLLAVGKLFKHKNVEFVVHNDLSEVSMDKSQHQFTLYAKQSKEIARVVGLAELTGLLAKDIVLGGNYDFSS